jgi:integrase
LATKLQNTLLLSVALFYEIGITSLSSNNEGIYPWRLRREVLGNGRAKILTPAEIDRLFDRGFITARDRLLFAVTFYCACRISEALALTTHDIVGGSVTLRKATTKGSSATRTKSVAKSAIASSSRVQFTFRIA